MYNIAIVILVIIVWNFIITKWNHIVDVRNPVKNLTRLSRILQEYTRVYPSKTCTHSCKERTISLVFCNILQEASKNAHARFLQDSCKMQDKWSFPSKNVQVLQGYSCKLLDSLIKLFTGIINMCINTTSTTVRGQIKGKTGQYGSYSPGNN